MSASSHFRIHSYSAHETDKSLAAYAEYVRDSLNASSVSWLISYRGKYGHEHWHVNLLDGWKVMDMTYPLAPGKDPEAMKMRYLEMARAQGDLSPLTRLAMDTAGTHRSLSLEQAFAAENDNSHWVKGIFFKQNNIADRILGVFSLNPETESYLLVDRSPEQPAFSRNDQDRLLELVKMFPRLHYWLAMERGLLPPSTRPLSPRQKCIINMMLKGLSEQEMAQELGLSKSTVHGYLVEIYRVYQIRSRAALQRLWLESI